MILKRLQIFFCLSFFISISHGQPSSRIKICLDNKFTDEPIQNKEVTITLNDTQTKVLKTDSNGVVVFEPIYGGRYKVMIATEGYKIETFKRVGVDNARGRIFLVNLIPFKDQKNPE